METVIDAPRNPWRRAARLALLSFVASLSIFGMTVGFGGTPAQANSIVLEGTQLAPSTQWWSTPRTNSQGSNLMRGQYHSYSATSQLGSYFTVQFWDTGRQRWLTRGLNFNHTTLTSNRIFANYQTGGTTVGNGQFTVVSTIHSGGGCTTNCVNRTWKITFSWNVYAPGGV